MGVREGQGMAFEFLAPRTALCKPFSTRRRISYGLPERSIGKTDVTFLASATGIENPLSGSRFLLRRFPLCRSALEDRTLEKKFGFHCIDAHFAILTDSLRLCWACSCAC